MLQSTRTHNCSIFSMLRCARLRPSSNLLLCSRLPCGKLERASLDIADLGQFSNGKIDTSKINVSIMDLEGNDAVTNIAGAARVLIKNSYGRVTFIRRDTKGAILEQHGWMKDCALGHLSFYYLHNPVIESLKQEEIENAVFQYDIVEASHLGLHIVNSRVAEDDSVSFLESKIEVLGEPRRLNRFKHSQPST